MAADVGADLSLSQAFDPESSAPPGFGELGVALAAQFGVFVAGTVVAIPFLKDDNQLTGGLTPILLSFLVSWPVLLGGVVVAAKQRGTSWRPYVDAVHLKGVDALAFFIGVGLQFVVALLYRLAGADGEKVSAPAKELADKAGGVGVGFALLACCTVIGAPIVEEFFYRGLVLNGLRNSAAPFLSAGAAVTLSVLGSALWFGGVHFQLLQLPALLLLGIVNGFIRVRIKRIGPCVLLHAGFNAATMVLLALEITN
jgi:membrane protease YdiL (CAAX protease family)